MYTIPSFKFVRSGKLLLKRDVLTGTGALDFPSLAANASATLNVVAKGAKVGDHVFVNGASAAGPVAGLALQAWVSAADTVTVRATNISGAVLDAASTSYIVTVLAA